MSAPQILTPPKAAAQLAISVRGLVNRFGAQIVHEKLDLDVRRGEILGVVGGSGTGKSVLLRTIIGLNRPTSGTINVLGTELIGASDKALRALERRWGAIFIADRGAECRPGFAGTNRLIAPAADGNCRA
jgi:phospholipid/cholesterol/gamma-HCH transport system ATP-binding protein